MNPSETETIRNILFVCTGNTCRSPMAEGIMKHLIPPGWKDRIRVESAGIMRFGGGYPSSELASRICAERGIDISNHLSRELTAEVVEAADLILVMERRHLEFARTMGGEGKAFLLTDYPDGSGSGKEVLDPIGMGPEVYSAVFEELEREIARVVGHVTGGAGDETV